MQIKKLLLKPVLLKPVLLKPVLLKPVLLKPVLLKPVLLKPVLLKPVLLKYSYNHFKGYKQAFNYNPYNGINIIYFGRVAMLECFKSAINKIFILNICKNKIILKIIIIKIILLINTNVNDIKYQKPQKLKTLQDLG